MAAVYGKLIPPYKLPRRALGERWEMRVTPELVDTVAFVCIRDHSGINIPSATAFFVEVPDESDPKRKWTYLITAQHCLDEIAGRDVVIRINTVPSIAAATGYEDIRTRKDDWSRHSNADLRPFSRPLIRSDTQYSKFRSNYLSLRITNSKCLPLTDVVIQFSNRFCAATIRPE